MIYAIETFEGGAWGVMKHPEFGDEFPLFVFETEEIAKKHLIAILCSEEPKATLKMRIALFKKCTRFDCGYLAGNIDLWRDFGENSLEDQMEWARLEQTWASENEGNEGGDNDSCA